MGDNSGSRVPSGCQEGIEIGFSPFTSLRHKDLGAMETITLVELPWVGIFEMMSVFSRALWVNKSLIYQKTVYGGRDNPLMMGDVACQFQLPGDGNGRAGGVFFPSLCSGQALEGNDEFGKLRRDGSALSLIRTFPGLKGLKATPAIPAGTRSAGANLSG